MLAFGGYGVSEEENEIDDICRIFNSLATGNVLYILLLKGEFVVFGHITNGT